MKDKNFSRRMTWACSLGCLVTAVLAIAWADPPDPQFTPIQRTQYVMSMIRGEFDGTTGNLVLIPLTSGDNNNANVWAESFYDAYGPLRYAEDHPTNPGEAIPWGTLTSEQKGNFYLRQLRKYHIAVRRGAEIPAATDSAKATAEAAVAADAALFPEIED